MLPPALSKGEFAVVFRFRRPPLGDDAPPCNRCAAAEHTVPAPDELMYEEDLYILHRRDHRCVEAEIVCFVREHEEQLVLHRNVCDGGPACPHNSDGAAATTEQPTAAGRRIKLHKCSACLKAMYCGSQC